MQDGPQTVSNLNKTATIIQSNTESKTKQGCRGLGRAAQVRYVHLIQMCSDDGDSVQARHRVEQGHVFGPRERQTLSAVMVHHLRDAGEHTAALVQGVAVLFSLSHDDVNAALARPNSPRREGGEEEDVFLSALDSGLTVEINRLITS